MGTSAPISEDRRTLAARFSALWLPVAVLFLSLSLSLLAWYVIQSQYWQNASGRFDLQRDRVVAAIKNRMLAYSQVLHGLQGLFAATEAVDRREFRTYVDHLDLQDRYPGIQGLAFVEIIPAGQLNEHTQRLRNEGFPDYEVWPQGERDASTAITYIEPFDWRNQRAFGYDMFSEPSRRAAMERARDTGQSAVSGKITLVQETNEDVQAGFIMYLPVYRNGAPHASVVERRAMAAGWIDAVFRVEDLMRGVLGDAAESLNLKIYSGEDPVPAALMYDSPANEPSGRVHTPAFTRTAQLTFGGQVWTLLLSIQSGPDADLYPEAPGMVLLVGCVLSLLLAGITWSVATSRDRAHALATAMTADLNAAKVAAEASNWELSRINQELRSERVERERTNQLLNAVLENIEAGVVACDSRGTLTLFNRATRNFHGLPAEPLPPERWAEYYDLFRSDGKSQMMTADVPLFRALQGEQVRDVEMMIVPKNGGPRRTLLASGRAMLAPDGAKLGAVVAMHDITERKRLEEQLRTHAEELEVKNRELEDFAYVASHDLQEPLRKIQAFGDLIATTEGKQLSETGKDYLQRMRRAASRMRTLIDDLLALSRVTSQTRPFVTVDLNRVARHAVADLDARIAQTGARVEISELPKIKGDPTQLCQMLHNLIANALKFQKEGAPPHIRIFARRVAEQLPEGREGRIIAWQVIVEDNGIGFDMKYLDRIFAPFERLHGRDQYEGTGVGLAICHKIITRHGGEITAYSETGEGSLFMVTLPAIEASSKDKPADSAITLARSTG
jgi:PAS domain S-box-containing protein